MAMDPEPEAAAGAPRQTLAMRLAERERSRALRAERLARLRPAADPADEAEAALEEFLRALGAGRPPAPPPAAAPGAVLAFQPRPERAPEPLPERPAASDLDGLPGAGPGLRWALERAGLRRLADLAPLAPADLAARLGPLGRLVPAEAWIAFARDAGQPAPDPGTR